ncbi:MAG TPA: NAD-dependent epimerase/dehydratase family protein [Candidatus Obscuribacterales bacterium]
MATLSGKVLITGGAGFIGSHLAERLVAEGCHVTVIDNLSSGTRENLAAVEDSVQLIVGRLADVLRDEKVDLRTFKYIFHLAANAYVPPSVADPLGDFHTTLENTILVLDALRRLAPPGNGASANWPKRGELPLLVNMSSAAVYGNPITLPISETAPTVPLSPYGVSKLGGERYVAVYSRLYGVRAVSIRLFSAYGPRQRKQVVYDLIAKVRKNPERVDLVGDGTQSRDFMYISDVIDALLLVANAGVEDGSVYNLASGESKTIAELLKTIVSLSKCNPEICYSGSVRSGDADRWEASIDKIAQLGFKAKVGISEGLAKTLAWYDQSRLETAPAGEGVPT